MKRHSRNFNRNFTILLYTEDNTHMQALEYIKNHYKYMYIIHNKDIEKETGEIKKEHIHCVINVGQNARSIKTVAEEIGIKENYIERMQQRSTIKISNTQR